MHHDSYTIEAVTGANPQRRYRYGATLGEDVTTENLRADLHTLPGVAEAEVIIREDEPPVARVWLDGTRAGDEVRELVDDLVGRSIPSVVLPKQTVQRRRTGLGRGLGDLIPNDVQESVPTHLQPAAGQRPTIIRVAIIESTRGVIVEIEDGTGGIHSESVGDGGDVDDAVMSAVAMIVDGPEEVRVDISDVETADGTVVLVTVAGDDRRSVGAAFVEYGRPYAVARAGLAALLDS